MPQPNTDMKNPNGPSIEDMEFALDCQMDDYIAEQEAKESKAVREAKCTVCKTAWVDVMNGQDTCDECKVA